MKYRKQEAKDAAREILKGIWTAMPYCWTAEDEFDEGEEFGAAEEYGAEDEEFSPETPEDEEPGPA